MSSAELPANVRLVNKEAGYAQVARAFKALGGRERIIGSVSREKWGSTRTGTRWFAYTTDGRRIDSADTQAQAVALVVNHRG